MNESGKILIADDEETFLFSTAELLSLKGYYCTCAPDAASAAERLREDHYDLLLADIKMPGNQNLEFIHELEHIAKGMPVILMTGYPSVQSAIQSIQLPVLAYLIKPVDFDELLQLVRFSIDRSRTYCAISNLQQRLKEWSLDLNRLEDVIPKPSSLDSPLPINTFLDLTLGHIVLTLLDVKHLTEGLFGQGREKEVCHLLDCPRSNSLMHALRETISVLEKTKSSFKSKDLGQLRNKLEEIIRKDEQGNA